MPYAGIEPNSTIIFYKDVLSDSNYENAYFFTYEAEQESFFSDTSRLLMTLSNNYYQRADRGVLKVGWTAQTSPDMYLLYGTPIKALYNASYMSFTNTSYENKKFYAFVNKVEYVNDSTVRIYYEIDVIRTWYFQFTELSGEKRIIPTMCLVEREHTYSDGLGEHTLPENLETGPYIAKEAIYETPFVYNPCVAVFCSLEESGPGGKFINGRNNSTFSKYFTGVSVQTFPLTVEGLNDLNSMLEDYTDINRIDRIAAIVMMPIEFASETEGYTSPRFIGIHGNGTLGGGYSPRNRKLLTHPFNLLYCTTNNGNTAEYRWENFTYYNGTTVNNVGFNVWGNCSPAPSLILYPTDYNGVAQNLDEAFILEGFPICSFNYDVYRAWLSQNAGTNLAGMINNATNIAVGALSQNYIGELAMLSGLERTNATVGKMFDYYTKPYQVKGDSSGDIVYQSGLMKYDFYYKVIKREYAEIIDNYFDMYGYKVNRVGYPVLNQRPCYTFIKTIGCEINGSSIPTDAEEKIKSIFNKGIRFWLDKNQIGVYGSGRTIPNTAQGE